MKVGEHVINEGDWISIDGSTGQVFLGVLDTLVPDISDPWLKKLLSWADDFRWLGVWANADYPADARRARDYGAGGIGLCRTEHMFFQAERLPFVQKMIMTNLPSERREALDALLPFQREDFIGLFKAMDGLPVIIRLIDPPLHEFLPGYETLMTGLADNKIRLLNAKTLKEIDDLLHKIEEDEHVLLRVEALREANPMLGLRGVRLGILMPDLTQMQVRAIFEAACLCAKEGVDVHPEVMIPLACHVNELKVQREALETVAKEIMEEQEIQIDYKFGTMIEIPRAALTSDEIAEYAQFFSFGTNDPHANDFRYQQGRRRKRVPHRLRPARHPAGKSFREPGRERGGQTDADQRGIGSQGTPGTGSGHLRGARRRSQVHRRLP